MDQISFSTNSDVLCQDCKQRPVMVLNGYQTTRCAACTSAKLRLMGGLFSDFEMLASANRLDDLAAGMSVQTP